MNQLQAFAKVIFLRAAALICSTGHGIMMEVGKGVPYQPHASAKLTFRYHNAQASARQEYHLM